MTNSTLRDKIEENLAELEKETRNSLIYIRGNLSEIEAYSTMIQNIFKYATSTTEPDDLQSRLVKASKVFIVQEGILQPKEPATQLGEKWLTHREAIGYWKQKDLEAGRTPITDHGYGSRIKSLEKGQQIQVRKRGRFIRKIEQNSLDQVIDSSRYNASRPIVTSTQQDKQKDEQQIKNAFDTNFQGIFYIAHVSNPETVEFIERERKKLSFEVILEVTFHHMFLNTEDYKIHRNRIKINPPLRKKELQEKILEYVLQGSIDIIGTDHAPHPIERKDSNDPPSGIPALPFWPGGIELLLRLGISRQRLEDITFNNANRIFKLGLIPEVVEVTYDPSLWEAYSYNPFSRLK